MIQYDSDYHFSLNPKNLAENNKNEKFFFTMKLVSSFCSIFIILQITALEELIIISNLEILRIL